MTIIQIITAIFAAISGTAAAFAYYYTYKQAKVRIEFEKQAREIQEKQKQLLQEASDFKEKLIAATLQVAPQLTASYNFQNLPSLRLEESSLFDRRRTHFAPEKDKLGETIVERISRQVEEDSTLTIILILDAGSTVFPIFQRLCISSIFQFDRSKADRLKIITNNLPGVSQLTKYGRVGDHRNAQTLFQCRILSGLAHSPYEASLSNQTATD